MNLTSGQHLHGLGDQTVRYLTVDTPTDGTRNQKRHSLGQRCTRESRCHRRDTQPGCFLVALHYYAGQTAALDEPESPPPLLSDRLPSTLPTISLHRSSLRPLGLFLRSSCPTPVACRPVACHRPWRSSTALRIIPRNTLPPRLWRPHLNRHQTINNHKPTIIRIHSSVRPYAIERCSQRRAARITEKEALNTAPHRLPPTIPSATDGGFLSTTHHHEAISSFERASESSSSRRCCYINPIDIRPVHLTRHVHPIGCQSPPARTIRDGLNLRAGPKGRSPQNSHSLATL